MTAITRLAVVGRLEFITVARLRWIRLFGVAFALLAVGSGWSAASARELVGVDGFARTTVAMVPLVLLLVPLVAVLVGVAGQAMEPGSDDFLFTQPLTRGEVMLGRWLGEAGAIGCALAAGFSAGAVVVAAGAGMADLSKFAIFAAATFALALAFLSLATLIAALSERRMMGLAAGAFVWFFFVLLFDALALAGAVALTGRAGARLLMASVFANPADLMRVLTLSLAGTPHLLGAAGDSWHRFLGGPATAAMLACLGLSAWIVAPLVAARWALGRRDL
jgi:Cu-processing system permease protein